MAFSTEPAHATHVSSINAKHCHILPHLRRPLRSLQVAHASSSFSCFAGDHSRPRVPQHGWVPRPPHPKTTAALVPRSARGGGRAPEDGGGRTRRRPGGGERGGPRRPWMPWTRAGQGGSGSTPPATAGRARSGARGRRRGGATRTRCRGAHHFVPPARDHAAGRACWSTAAPPPVTRGCCPRRRGGPALPELGARSAVVRPRSA